MVCGFGRVGQNLARVLERRGFEYIALDFDPFRVRDARTAGDPVVYGDATHPEVLRALGLDHASVVVISFDEPETAVRIVRAVRRLRADVPVLVRTEDDKFLEPLQAAGATEVVPGIFETSLALVSHVLLFLRVPPAEVLETTEQIRHERYAILRSVFQRRDPRAAGHRRRRPGERATALHRRAAAGRPCGEPDHPRAGARPRAGESHRDPPRRDHGP